MTVGVVTAVEHEGETVTVAEITTEDRKRYARALANQLSALDGVEEAVAADATRTWDGVQLEIMLETKNEHGSIMLATSPRSLSPRIRNTVDDYALVASYEVTHTPMPINADRDLYEDAYYIVDVRFY